jgi:hypothetical protein
VVIWLKRNPTANFVKLAIINSCALPAICRGLAIERFRCSDNKSVESEFCSIPRPSLNIFYADCNFSCKAVWSRSALSQTQSWWSSCNLTVPTIGAAMLPSSSRTLERIAWRYKKKRHSSGKSTWASARLYSINIATQKFRRSNRKLVSPHPKRDFNRSSRPSTSQG